MNVAVGCAQYPVCPGAGPRRGCPSGQRGVGAAAAVAAGFEAAMSNNFLFVLVITTEFAHTCFVPFRAERPCTVRPSPGFTVSRPQPPFPRSTGLSSSTAQLATEFPLVTFIKIWT